MEVCSERTDLPYFAANICEDGTEDLIKCADFE